MGSNLSIGKLPVPLHTSGSLTTAVENEKGIDGISNLFELFVMRHKHFLISKSDR